MNAKLIGIIVLLALLIVLAIQNYQPLTLKFFFWAFETSVVLVLLVSFLIGALVGGLVVWIGRGKKEDLAEGGENLPRRSDPGSSGN